MRLSRAAARPVAAAAAVVVGAVAAIAGSVAVAPAAYAVDNVCLMVDDSVPPGDTGRASLPFEQLGMAQAQEAAPPPRGGPVRVAVLGPGVRGGAVPVHATVLRPGGSAEVVDPLGTQVAGLVAGDARPDGQPVGFAPDAEIVDVRVYVDGESDEDAERPSAAALADGLRWVAQQARRLDIKVAVVPVAVRADRGLRAAVRAAQGAGVVVVAATGDRPASGSELASLFATDLDDPRVRTEDAGPLLFPAGYPGVVAVNSSGDPDGAFVHVLKNSRTSVAAPSYDAVSYGLNGDTCLVQPTSTAAAAGEVAGVLALLWQRYPDETAAQVVTRLVHTADGSTVERTPLIGAGVVQPYEALTRPLAPARDGSIEQAAVEVEPPAQAAAPEPAPDPVAQMRDNAVWWGLLGGGLLVVALLLRPVLARRR